MQQHKHHIFISYSRANSDKKDQIVSDLRAIGIDCWVDSSNIPLGTNWLAQIQHGIENSHIFLYLGSREAMNSPNVGFELGYATCCGTVIIPILIKGHDIAEGIPEWLRTKQIASKLRGTGQYEQHKHRFFVQLCTVLLSKLLNEFRTMNEVTLSQDELLSILAQFNSSLSGAEQGSHNVSDDDLSAITERFVKFKLLVLGEEESAKAYRVSTLGHYVLDNFQS